MESGIYLSKHGERVDASRQNTITGNVITGFKMAERCIVPLREST